MPVVMRPDCALTVAGIAGWNAPTSAGTNNARAESDE